MKHPKNIADGQLTYSWHNLKNRMIVTSAEFQGLEHPIAWSLAWFDGEWVAGFLPPGGDTWLRTTPHDLFPPSAEDYARAVHVAQVIARRFARSYEPQDGRGRFSELARAAQELKLMA